MEAMTTKPRCDDDPQAARRPYSRPTLTAVPLRPDEAVLGPCKNNNSAGALQGICNVPAACSSINS